MEASAEVLMVGGAGMLLVGFLLGVPLSAARMTAPAASRHLVTAHLSAIIQGATLLAVSAVMHASDLPRDVESTAAVLLVAGSVLFVAGAVTNWRQDIDDHFAVRSLGWRLFAISGPTNILGAALVLVGLARGL